MRVQVTVFDVKRDLELNMGEEVLLVHDPDSPSIQYDPKVFEVYKNEEKIGVVGSKPGSTVLSGCITNSELYDRLKNKMNNYMEIKGVVTGEGQVTFRNKRIRTAYIVEVKIPARKNVLKFVLTVRGSVKEYSGKVAVLKRLQEGEQPTLWLKLEENDLVTFIQEGGQEKPAGIVSKVEEGDMEQLKEYLAALAKRDAAQVVVATEASGTSYTVQFELNKKTFQDTLDGKVVKTFAEVRREVIENGIVPEERLIAIERYLRDNNVEEELMKKVFESYERVDPAYQHRVPSEPKTKYIDTAGLVRKCIAYLNAGKFLRFEGTKGTGKNTLIETLAWIYQRPLFEMSLTGQTDKFDLFGSKTFETTTDHSGNKVTEMIFEKEALVEALECGGFFNLDEINAADESVLFCLQAILDDRRRVQVPGYGLVHVHPKFRMIATMNPLGYVGTRELPDAVNDRFVPIIFSEQSSISKLLTERVPDAIPEHVDICDRVFSSLMTLYQNNEISERCITIRGFIDALDISPILGIYEALIDNVANRINDLEYRRTVESVIDDIAG